MAKLRVIKDYEKLSDDLLNKVKEYYPNGYLEFLVRFVDKDGKNVSALPYEDDEKCYLIRMTNEEASKIYKRENKIVDEEIEEEDEVDDRYTDLDSMHIGGHKKDEEAGDYD